MVSVSVNEGLPFTSTRSLQEACNSHSLVFLLVLEKEFEKLHSFYSRPKLNVFMKHNNVEFETDWGSVVSPGSTKWLSAVCTLPKGLADAIGSW